jgi:hypothetical protein
MDLKKEAQSWYRKTLKEITKILDDKAGQRKFERWKNAWLKAKKKRGRHIEEESDATPGSDEGVREG